MAEVEEDCPVEVTLVLHGGRVGEELGNMALLEVGSAIAAVTSPPRGEETRVREIYAPTGATDGPRFDPIPPHPRAHEPEWMHDDVPRAFPGASHPTIAGQLAHCHTLSHAGQNCPSLCNFAHSAHRPVPFTPPSLSNGT